MRRKGSLSSNGRAFSVAGAGRADSSSFRECLAAGQGDRAVPGVWNFKHSPGIIRTKSRDGQQCVEHCSLLQRAAAAAPKGAQRRAAFLAAKGEFANHFPLWLIDI